MRSALLWVPFAKLANNLFSRARLKVGNAVVLARVKLVNNVHKLLEKGLKVMINV